MKMARFQVKASDAFYVTAPLTRGTSSQLCDVSNTYGLALDSAMKSRWNMQPPTPSLSTAPWLPLVRDYFSSSSRENKKPVS